MVRVRVLAEHDGCTPFLRGVFVTSASLEFGEDTKRSDSPHSVAAQTAVVVRPSCARGPKAIGRVVAHLAYTFSSATAPVPGVLVLWSCALGSLVFVVLVGLRAWVGCLRLVRAHVLHAFVPRSFVVDVLSCGLLLRLVPMRLSSDLHRACQCLRSTRHSRLRAGVVCRFT